MTISTTIKTIQDIMRKDVGVDGDAQRIGQLVWMLFMKIFDAIRELMAPPEKTRKRIGFDIKEGRAALLIISSILKPKTVNMEM